MFTSVNNYIDKVLATKFFKDDSFMATIIISLYLLGVVITLIR